ncbi:MAG: HEAT repeat domain-containing protein [Euryarchaeota archaeon]|nr:HEAT repeat domain-containing protein [Euryarchaeota archaeon]
MKAYDVRTLRPCGSGGIIVEGHFGREFSMHELCSLLQGMAKCSEKLGVARLSHEGYNITIYRKGRVDVHGVASEEEAIEFINEIKIIVEAAFVATHVDALITALSDENSTVRQKAAETLGEGADRRAVEPLAHALTDSDADVRLSAALALGMIGDASGTAPLTFALKNEKDEAVLRALELALDMVKKNIMSKKMRIF